mgnify:CR=1 FL=1
MHITVVNTDNAAAFEKRLQELRQIQDLHRYVPNKEQHSGFLLTMTDASKLKSLLERGSRIYLAVEGADLAGYLIATPHQVVEDLVAASPENTLSFDYQEEEVKAKEACFIYQIAVHPKYLRHQVGVILLDYIRKNESSRHLLAGIATFPSNNHVSVAFFKAYGFSRIGRMSVKGDGSKIDTDLYLC